jgi:GT2 family glycosyltransferase
VPTPLAAPTPRIAVVIVTWNSAAVLPGLLTTLDAGLGGLAGQVVVADNDSADDSVAVAQRFYPGCRIVQTGRNAGYAAAINAALAAADPYDAALILNPDIRLDPGCVETMYARLADDGVGIVVPRLFHGDGSIAWSLRREPTLLRAFGDAVLGRRAGRYSRLGETVLDEAAYAGATTVDWATGAVMLISAACLAACGPWDESYFLYSEETEFALRARDRGFLTRLAPEARAVHLEGESKVSPRLWTILTINRVKLYRRRHTRFAAALYWMVVLLREVSRAALGHPRSRRATAALLRPSALRSPVTGP